jgi:predicted nucleotidyltransferase
MPESLRDRRAYTSDRTRLLRSRLRKTAKLVEGKACVYATGSYGRGEAGASSDLDVFIVGHVERDDGRVRLDKRDRVVRRLSRIDEILVKADLIRATQSLDFPPFDGDGEYLQHYAVSDLISTLGTPEDDALNTFTARLLLLLESTPLLGKEVHTEAIELVIDAYWGDYHDHQSHFSPAFLANDILRLWRTFCVNYEARTRREPSEEKAKRKLKNYNGVAPV